LRLQDHSHIAEFDRERRALEDAIAIVESHSLDTPAKPARSSTPYVTEALTCATNEPPCRPETGHLQKNVTP
jgi:hypothetical protein